MDARLGTRRARRSRSQRGMSATSELASESRQRAAAVVCKGDEKGLPIMERQRVTGEGGNDGKIQDSRTDPGSLGKWVLLNYLPVPVNFVPVNSCPCEFPVNF